MRCQRPDGIASFAGLVNAPVGSACAARPRAESNSGLPPARIASTCALVWMCPPASMIASASARRSGWSSAWFHEAERGPRSNGARSINRRAKPARRAAVSSTSSSWWRSSPGGQQITLDAAEIAIDGELAHSALNLVNRSGVALGDQASSRARRISGSSLKNRSSTGRGEMRR